MTWINIDNQASSIYFNPSGTDLSATDLQGAIAELDQLKDTFALTAGRNATIGISQALRRVNGVFTNVAPYRIPTDCELVALTAESSSTGAWDLDVLQNGGSIHTETKTGGVNFVTNTSLSIDFSVGDSLQLDFLFTGAATSQPSCTLYFRGR